MPAIQRGSVRKLAPGKVQLRYYDDDGVRRSAGVFPSRRPRSQHYRDVIEPRLRGERRAAPELTLAEFVDALPRRGTPPASGSRTIATLRERLRHATRDYGDVPLRELERMVDELAGWQAHAPRALPLRDRAGALRQTLAAAVRWGYMRPRTRRSWRAEPAAAAAADPRRTRSPSSTRSPPSSRARYRPLPAFAAATGLRPEEWAALERRDVDRDAGIVNVRRTVSDGEVVELGKTSRQPPPGAALAPRRSPRSTRSRRGSTRRSLFPAPEGGLLNLDNFRRREWRPAVEASGVARPARIYDLRSTFASNALAAGVTVFELARVMGTSVRDDRASLRDAARRRPRRDRRTPRRARGRARAGRPRDRRSAMRSRPVAE